MRSRGRQYEPQGQGGHLQVLRLVCSPVDQTWWPRRELSVVESEKRYCLSVTLNSQADHPLGSSEYRELICWREGFIEVGRWSALLMARRISSTTATASMAGRQFAAQCWPLLACLHEVKSMLAKALKADKQQPGESSAWTTNHAYVLSTIIAHGIVVSRLEAGFVRVHPTKKHKRLDTNG